MKTDTIAAVATGLAQGGINIIRVSGNEAVNIVSGIFKSASSKEFSKMKSYTAAYGHIIYEGRIIDEVIVLLMKAPATYTREDVVEIDCHGGIVVTRTILDIILKNGARLAEPGEFTKRAFLNGRIDLSQAEAVIDVISAGSELALRNSLNQLNGNIKNAIAVLRNRIISKTAYLEAALDDPEHISLEGFTEELQIEINAVLLEIRKLIGSCDSGRMIKEGINTVFLGLPNAGKSSLMNALSGTDRAIVTDIPGTTRDILTEHITFEGLALNIIDTAGIRETDNIIEKIGVDKAREAALNCDLILYVIDSSVSFTGEDIENIVRYKEKKTIVVFNKSDLVDSVNSSDSINEIREELRKYACSDIPVVSVSVVDKSGFDVIKKCITDMFFNGQIKINEDIYITNLRHKQLLSDAAQSLENVLQSIDCGMPEDFFTIDMMDAYTSLGLITGDNLEDDLADKIFSDFCMGK